MRKQLTESKRKMVRHNGKGVLHAIKLTEWNDTHNSIAVQYQFAEVAMELNIPLKVMVIGNKDINVVISPEHLAQIKDVKSFDDKVMPGTKHHIYYYPMPKVFRKHLDGNQLKMFN
jgi:hypothetical protein